MSSEQFYEDLKLKSDKHFAELEFLTSCIGLTKAKLCVNELLERVLLELDASQGTGNLKELRKHTKEYVLHLCRKVENVSIIFILFNGNTSLVNVKFV